MSDRDRRAIDDLCDDSGHVDCAAVFAKLDLIIDGEMSVDELREMEVHLAACVPCADRADFEHQLKALVRERCADQAPPELIARIRDALQLPTG